MAAESTTRRLFITLELPEALRQELRERVGMLQKLLDGQSLRWVPEPNRHLTLLFLGDTPDEGLDDIKQAMDRIAAAQLPLPVRLTSHGVFPKAVRPSILWVGLDGGDALPALAAKLAEALGRAAEEKPFVPHSTVARVPSRAGDRERQKIGAVLQELKTSKPSAAEEATELSLYESRLRSAGAEYIRLHRCAGS